MALKDLVADRSKITEEIIENIVADYVRYDPSMYEIVLTPSGIALGNDAKVLVMLVAIMGWEYVVDKVHALDTRPAALEALTGIPGGTLRPVLKKLKDAHLLAVDGGNYSVRVANLDAIRRAVHGEKMISPKRGSRKAKASNSQTSTELPKVETDDCSAGASANKSRRKAGVPVRASLVRLIEVGFFAEPRTFGQVVARLHEMAIIVKNTSLSGPIADLVRERKLERKKIIEGSKEIWSYRAS